MNYRVQEVGYKVVKLGRHTVSCSLSALGAIFAIGALSTFAHSANAQSAPSVVDLDSFFSSPSSNLTVTQGSGSTGYMVGGAENGAFFTQTGRGFTGDATGTYTDFYTVGGNGSGGGAGLGGAFYVDIDGDLTMRDVQFTGNVARGGTGGGVTPVALRAAEIGLTEREASIASAVSFNITPTDLSGSSFSKLELEEANTRFAVGQKVRVDGAIGVSTIEAINGNEITLKSSLTVDNSSVQSLSASISGQTITGQALTDLGSSASFAVGSLVLGNGVPAGTTLTSVTRNNDNLITSMTLSDSATVSGANNLQFINLPKVEAAQYVSLGAAGTVYLEDNTTVDTARSGLYRIEASAAALGLTVGMELTGNGVPVGTKVTAIDTTSDAGTDIVYLSTVDSSNPLEALSFDGSMMVGEVGKDYIQLSTPDTRVVVGGFISGVGIPDGTRVAGYDSRTGRITLTDQLTAIPEAVTTSAVLGQTSNSITVASASGIAVGMNIEGDGITSGAKVAAVTQVDGGDFEVTLTSGSVTGTVTGFVASSELSTGGSLNNLEVLSAYSAGTDGKDGKNGNSVLPYITDGEGLEGTPGQGANLNDNQDVDYAPGGVGGDGGDGSNGVPFNYEAIKNTKKATGEFVEKITEAAAALGNAPFPSFSTSAALITASISKGINLTVEIINSVKWIQGMTEGTVALGGEGGEGGAGGDGGEFYGGGAGGAGGNGGAGALSYTTGGAGGSGGEGGTGGFGAGGGQGGDSGDAGPTGYALEGDPGAGGSAGFAAGEGSDGWNRFGGGGSGYGGAVFVRGSVDGTTGGNLKIEGNALFRNNYVLGGSSTNGGEAGQAAGGDLFIMKGARVDLMPGAGKTIRFEGAIADNSIASIEGGSWSAGEGADLHIGGGGLVQLAGENTYSGKTYIHGSTTEVTLGEGIYPDSSIVFEGAGNITGSGGIQPHFGAGTLFLAEDVVQRVGANVPGQISWDGAGGFSAATAEGIVLNFGRITDDGDGQKLYWGSSYIASDSTLVFGSEYSLGSVTWMNNIDLQTHTGNIVVFDSKQIDDATGEKVADLAFVRGDLTNGALRIGDTGYDGTLLLLGTNDLTGITVEEGLVLTTDGETTGRLFDTTNGGFVDVNAGGWLVLTGSETVTSVDVAQNGILMSSQGLTSDNAITNEGVMSLSGVNDLASVWNKSTGNLATNANMDVFDGNLRNDGRWDILADQTITIDDSDASTLSEGLVGNGVFCLETTGADAAVCNTAEAPEADVAAAATTLTLDQAGSSTFDGKFEGLGALNKTGAGSLSLTVAQSFLGGLTVSAGEVVAKDAATFADSLDIDVATDANLRLTVVDTFGTLTNSGNTFVEADLTATSMSTTGGFLELGANVTTTGAFNLADTDTSEGTMSLASGDQTITTGGGLTGDGKIDVGGSTLTLSQGAEATSTFRGNIVQDTDAQTGEFTLTGGGHLILEGETDQVSLSKLNVTNGKLSLNGSELLVDTIEVLVDQLGTLVAFGDETVSAVTVAGDATTETYGALHLYEALTATDVSNSGEIFVDAGTEIETISDSESGLETSNGSLTATDVSNSGEIFVDAGTEIETISDSESGLETSNGSLTATGTITNTAYLVQDGSVSADVKVVNNGLWAVVDDETLTITNTTGGLATDAGLTGAGTFCLETSGADAAVCNTAEAPEADVAAAATTLTLDQAGSSTFDGKFEGLGALNKTGAGSLSLTVAQSFLGGLTVSAGEVVAKDAATFADSLDIDVATDANLRLTVVDTFGTLTNSGNTFVEADLTATSMSTTGGFLELGANVTTTGAFNLADTDTSEGTMSLASGDQTITTGGGLTGDGDINVGADTLKLSQAEGVISTFRGDIVEDTDAQTGEFILTGGGHLILAGDTDQVSVSKLNIINGKLSLNGSELLIDTIDVLVDQLGALALIDASDEATIRTESIETLSGTGRIELGRNTLNIENGGNFEGVFTGTGTVNVEDGAFTVNNSLTSEDGGLTVSNAAGTTISAGTDVDVDNVSVSAGARLNVTGTGTGDTEITRVTANDLTVDSNATLHLGTGSYGSGSEDNNVVDADDMVLNGTVSGSGTLRADNITVTAASSAPRANIRPGDSPGVQNFFANTYTFGDNSSLEIEVVDHTRAAGIGYDQVRFTNPNGSLVLEGDTVLSIVDLASHTNGTTFNFNADNYALGNVTQFAVVAPSSVTGVFDTVAHTRLSANTNNFAVNLGTGSLVGLGVKNLADTATTDNEAAMIAGMKVASSGAADQYYGGKFIENLTQAWAGNHDLGTVYDKASPEIYAGVGSSAEAAVMGGAPEWMAGFLASEGKTTTFVDYGISHFRSDDNGEEFNTFGVRTSNRKVGFNISSDVATLLFNIGTTTSALQSDYLTGSGTGVNFGAAVVGEVSSIQGLSWTAGFQHASMELSGQRVSNNGIVNFADVGTRATQFNLGFEYNTEATLTDIGLRANVMFGSSKSDGFNELGGTSSQFDAMKVESIENDFARLDLGMKFGSAIGQRTKLIGSIDTSIPLSTSPVGVDASYDQGQAAFSVNSRGLDGASMSASIGIDQALTSTSVLSARVGLENTWSGNSEVTAGFGLRYNF